MDELDRWFVARFLKAFVSRGHRVLDDPQHIPYGLAAGCCVRIVEWRLPTEERLPRLEPGDSGLEIPIEDISGLLREAGKPDQAVGLSLRQTSLMPAPGERALGDRKKRGCFVLREAEELDESR